MFPFSLGLPLIINTLHCLPDTLFNMADAGDTTAAPAAAIVTFLMKSLLSIGVTATILCKDNEIHVSYQEMMIQKVLGMTGSSPKLLVLGNLK